MTVPSQSALATAVVEALRRAGLYADLARKPEGVPNLGATKTPRVGYAVVYPLPGGARDGSVARPDDDLAWPFQVTCIAADPTAAQDIADDVEAALQTLSVPARTVTRVEPTSTGGVRRDDAETPPLYYATPRWLLHTTPA